MAGGGRAGAGGRARPGGPHPGVPAPSAAQEEEEDDLQIHAEGGATEPGAVSGLLRHPSPGRGRLRRAASALDPSQPGLLTFPFPGRGKENVLRNSLLPDLSEAARSASISS